MRDLELLNKGEKRQTSAARSVNEFFKQCDLVQKEADDMNFENGKDRMAYINMPYRKAEMTPGPTDHYDKQAANKVKCYNLELCV